jgi:hypothetical protein
MSDCALSIANAIKDVYENSGAPLKHYWCLFHILKAFRGKEKTYLKDQEAFEQFKKIMYSNWQDRPLI